MYRFARVWAAAALFAVLPVTVWAQSAAEVLPLGCGTGKYGNGSHSPTMDPQGRICVGGGAGTAGAPNAAVTSVQGVAGGTPQSTSPAPTALTNSTRSTMGTTATIIVPFSATRQWVMISSRTAGTETQDIGSSNVVVGGGIPVPPGGGFLFNGPGAAGPIYGITTVAGSVYSYVEG